MAPTDPDEPTRPEDELDETRVRPADVTPGEQTGGWEDPNVTRVRAEGATEAASVTVPGFTIHGILGRGGMGIVYRATQDGLNREVALKMLLAGPFADPSLRSRFLVEAEAVASLEHPHIIKVLTFGEAGGNPYLAMEFAPGGNLAERLKATGPLPAAEAASVLAKLAGAVAHAHSRGVVHRDIKPQNVMLGADGEPRLTDFGLAKVGRLDQELSVTGQVLGTPAYMAPEQAAGKVREVGTAADVYALGAVLYDLLTGRPPFRGDSVAVTLQKVLDEEPERPRRHNRAVPRDLETVCLKCLTKNPGGRYSTAQALADDLLRYARGEPVAARPAGAMERGWKWVKRNKVATGAAAAVALSLVTGAVVSVGFGLEARQKQKDAEAASEVARKETGRADRERDDAIAARNDLTSRNKELEDSRRQLNRNLARSLLGPFRTNASERLTSYEVGALWSLAEVRGEPAALMFLEEAVRSPAAAQFEARAEFAWHAAVGLDAGKRAAAGRLVATSLRDTNATDEHRVRLALAAARWEDAPAELSETAATLLARALTTATDPDVRYDLAWGVVDAAGKLPAERATEILAGALTTAPDPLARRALAEGLVDAAGRAPAGLVARTARALANVLATETEARARGELAARLAGAAGRLPAGRAADLLAKPADLLASVLVKAPDPDACSYLANGLVALAGRLPAERAADLLTGALTTVTDPLACRSLAQGLADAAGRLPADRAADLMTRPAEVLAGALATATDPLARRSLVAALAEVAGRLPADRATDLLTGPARALADALAKTADPDACRHLAWGLVNATGRLSADRAAEILVGALGSATDPLVREVLAQGLADAAGRLPADRAADLLTEPARALADALATATESHTRSHLANGLAALTGRLPADRAADLVAGPARVVANVLATETEPPAREKLAGGLAALAGRLPPDRAADLLTEPVRVLTDALGKVTPPIYCENLAKGLAALAGRLPAGRATDLLAGALTKETNPLARKHLAAGLAAQAGRLPADRAADLVAEPAEVLTAALAQETSPDTRGNLAGSWAALVGRLPAGRATDLLAGALAQETSPNAREALAAGLADAALGLRGGRISAQGATAGAVSTAGTPGGLLPGLALLHPEVNPRPQPLPPQILVELLKSPGCFGAARRVVLDALEVTYHRPFKDQWEFVEYAQKHLPHLDLLSPPKRIQP